MSNGPECGCSRIEGEARRARSGSTILLDAGGAFFVCSPYVRRQHFGLLSLLPQNSPWPTIGKPSLPRRRDDRPLPNKRRTSLPRRRRNEREHRNQTIDWMPPGRLGCSSTTPAVPFEDEGCAPSAETHQWTTWLGRRRNSGRTDSTCCSETCDAFVFSGRKRRMTSLSHN